MPDDQRATWTPSLVEARIAEAARTLALLTSPDSAFYAAARGTSWTDVPPDPNTAYGYTQASGGRPMAPQSAISRMEQTYTWQCYVVDGARPAHDLPPDIWRILWSRAAGARWERLRAARETWWGGSSKRGGGRSRIPGGNSRSSLIGLYSAGLAQITAGLNRDGVAVQAAEFADL